MAQTNLTRAGVFDNTKLQILEGQLAQVMPRPFAVYGGNGIVVNWPNGLTAPQITQAQAIINAYVQPTDTSQLTQLQAQALNFLALANPTTAQQTAALKAVVKVLLQITTGKIKIDGTDISS